MPNNDLNIIIPTLLENRTKPFVKRILNRKDYPVLNNPDGSYSTHSMAWGNVDNQNIVYPTVVYNEQNRSMQRLEDREALDNAMRSGNYIKFDTPEEADYFSQNYKKYWEAE